MYAFSYERLCECTQEYRGPFLVQVQDDNVTKAETRDDGTALSADDQKSIPTIDELFDKIQQGIDLNSAEIRVTYNEFFGYPESVFIDYDYQLADEEFSARVDYFAPVGSWQQELDQRKQIWESQDIQSYTYQYDQVTQNVDAPNPKLVEVLDGIVLSVNREPVQAIANSSLPEIPTMEALFFRIQQAIDMEAFSVQVAYAVETGHPLEIHIDYDDRLVDDDWIVMATYPVEGDDGIVVKDNATNASGETTAPSMAPSNESSATPCSNVTATDTSPPSTSGNEVSSSPSESLQPNPSKEPTLSPVADTLAPTKEPTPSPVADILAPSKEQTLSPLAQTFAPKVSPTDDSLTNVVIQDSDSSMATQGSVGCVVVWTALVVMLGIPCF